MKPYLRERKIKGAGIWKKDNHPHPKKKYVNWWENEFNNFISRTTMKFKVNKEIKKDIRDLT